MRAFQRNRRRNIRFATDEISIDDFIRKSIYTTVMKEGAWYYGAEFAKGLEKLQDLAEDIIGEHKLMITHLKHDFNKFDDKRKAQKQIEWHERNIEYWKTILKLLSDVSFKSHNTAALLKAIQIGY